MLRRLRLAVGLLFLWPEVAGCGGSAIAESSSATGGSDGNPGCQTGSVRCSCYPNDTCDGDLVCASDLCVALGTAGTMSTGGAGSAGAGASAATGGLAGASGGVTGGSGGTGGEALCPNVTPCGGELVGTWTVTSSCLTVSGEVDVRYLGLDHCESVSVTGSLDVTGTWTADADGTYSDNTTTTGTETLELHGSCLLVEATCTVCPRLNFALASVGYASVTCEENPNSEYSLECGLGCTCSATIDQAGGLGVAPRYPSASGTYTVAGSTLTVTAGEQEYAYCVSGSTLTVTPLSTDTTGTLTGTVVLERQ